MPQLQYGFFNFFWETDMKPSIGLHAPVATLAAIAAVAVIALAAPMSYSQTTPSSQNGRWLTESGNLEIDLAPCGAALCGTVVKVLANRSMSAPGAEAPMVDATKLIGTVILSDFKATGEGEWKGQIFNRDNDKLYSALLSHPKPDQLVIRSYIGLPIFGKTQVWRRVGAVDAAK